MMDSEEPSLCVEKVASLGEGSSLHLDVGEPEADTVASEQDRFEVAEPKVVDTSPASTWPVETVRFLDARQFAGECSVFEWAKRCTRFAVRIESDADTVATADDLTKDAAANVDGQQGDASLGLAAGDAGWQKWLAEELIVQRAWRVMSHWLHMVETLHSTNRLDCLPCEHHTCSLATIHGRCTAFEFKFLFGPSYAGTTLASAPGDWRLHCFRLLLPEQSPFLRACLRRMVAHALRVVTNNATSGASVFCLDAVTAFVTIP